MSRYLGLAAILVYSLLADPVFAGASRPDTPVPGKVKIGETAPDFTLQDLSGQSVNLSLFRGKVVVLNFWATWCPPCRAEMPSMERLNEVYNGKDFVMLAVNIEEGDEAAVKTFLGENPHSFSVLLDPEAKVQNLYGVYKVPETFIIDKQGKIVERVIGAVDWSSVEVLKYFSSLVSN